MTGSGRWVGTLGYIAPEQIRGEGVDARADVYALGCLLFYVLTGVAPLNEMSRIGTFSPLKRSSNPPLGRLGFSTRTAMP